MNGIQEVESSILFVSTKIPKPHGFGIFYFLDFNFLFLETKKSFFISSQIDCFEKQQYDIVNFVWDAVLSLCQSMYK